MMLAAIGLFEKLANGLEKHSIPCFYKKYFGIECPGCGMQRSFIELLRGNFIESFKIYPALATTIAVFVLLILHLLFKFKNGAKYILIIFILNSIVVVINYLLKF